MKVQKLTRRDFLKIAGTTWAAISSDPSLLFSSFKPKKMKKINDLLDMDYSFPYDIENFQASERVVFIDFNILNINILPKEGKTLDIRLYYSHDDEMINHRSKLLAFSGVNDSLEIPIRGPFWNPEFHYRIEYRESGNQNWKAGPPRTVKTPQVSLEEREIEVILIGDDHTPDDADMENTILNDDYLRELRLNGDYVNLFLKELIKNPDYTPERGSELAKLMNGFCMASTIRQIISNENPDFIINLGDQRGGFYHKWEGLGLTKPCHATDAELDQYSKNFRIGTRKMLSALTPEIPIYWALGNHDGESGYSCTVEPATKYRKKFFKLPGVSIQGNLDENFYPLIWGAQRESNCQRERAHGGILFIMLDNQRYNSREPQYPEDWTLGAVQKAWFEKILKYEADWKFVLYHHVLGGWPSGASECEKDYAYGRGPLFTYEDYAQFCEDPNLVEQVELTRLMQENGVDIILNAHDHIFNVKEIDNEFQGKKMYGICVGSIKYFGELNWYKGDYWKMFYGDHGRYWGESEKADFWGPSGYTKLTITKESVKVEYIRSANNHPYTNIPQHIKVGDVISVFLL